MSKKDKNIVLIIAEKSRAAERIAFALKGDSNIKVKKINNHPIFELRKGNYIFRILGVKGHLYTTEFAKEIHKKPWRSVDPKWLLTNAPLTKIPTKNSRHLIRLLKNELQKANMLIIATDYDREGENIGMQIYEYIVRKVNPNITLKRAIFSSLTKNELLRAFKEENLTTLNKNKIAASEVRQEVDLRYGVAFTRLATMKLHERLNRFNLQYLSIGPCQTPTLGLVVDRYEEHTQSMKSRRKLYYLQMKLKLSNDFIITLTSQSFQDKNEILRIFELLNKQLGKTLSSIRGIDITISKKIEVKKRPVPLNTYRLASLASKYLNFSSSQTLKLAEKLYLNGLISYPRTETEVFDDQTKRYLFKLIEIAKSYGIIPSNLKTVSPRAGKGNDHAHPPIHPKKILSHSELSKFDPNERKLYHLITVHTIACFAEDATFTQYNITLNIGIISFSKKLYKIDELGFLKIYDYLKRKMITETSVIQKITKEHLENATIIGIDIKDKLSTVIPPISEHELIRKMEKLGIGTDATFAEHIQKLVERGYVLRKHKYLIPTPYGISLAKALKEIVPKVIDPHIRAEIESLFIAVEEGKISQKAAVKKAISMFVKLYDEFYSHIDEFIEHVISGLKETGLEILTKKRSRKGIKKLKTRRRRKRKK